MLPMWQRELLLITTPLPRLRPWRLVPARGVGPSGEVMVITAVVVEVDMPGHRLFHLLEPRPRQGAGYGFLVPLLG